MIVPEKEVRFLALNLFIFYLGRWHLELNPARNFTLFVNITDYVYRYQVNNNVIILDSIVIRRNEWLGGGLIFLVVGSAGC